MATASVKVYIGDKLIRTYGCNKADSPWFIKTYEPLTYEQFLWNHPGHSNVTEEEFKTMRVVGYRGKEKAELSEELKSEVKLYLSKYYPIITETSLEEVYAYLKSTNKTVDKVLRKIRFDKFFRYDFGIFKDTDNKKHTVVFTEKELVFFMQSLLCAEPKFTENLAEVKKNGTAKKIWCRLSADNQYLINQDFSTALKLDRLGITSDIDEYLPFN